MILKKSKITYLFWFIYAVAFLGNLYISAIGIANEYVMDDSIESIAAIMAGTMFFTMILTLVARKLDFSKESTTLVEMSYFTEIILVTALTLFAFMLRFIYLTTAQGEITDENNLFDLILKSDNTQILSIGAPAFYYSKLVNVFIIVFGSDIITIAYLEAFMQLILNLMIYYAVRLLMGKTPAFMAAVLFAFLPWNVLRMYEVQSQTFIAFVFVLAFMMIIYSSFISFNNKASGSNAFLSFLLAGAFSGFAAYVDKLGLVFLIFAIFSFHMNRPVKAKNIREDADETVEDGKTAIKKPAFMSLLIGQILVYIVAYVVSFIAGAFYCSLNSDYTLDSLLNNYIQGFNGISYKGHFATPAYGDISSLILISLAGIWLIRIFLIERDHGSYILIIPIGFIVISMLGIEDSGYLMATTCFWCILGGMGFAAIGSNNLENALRQMEIKEKQREENRLKAEEAHQRMLEREKEEQRFKNSINEEARKRDKEKFLLILNENSPADNNQTGKEANKGSKFLEQVKKEQHSDMFGRNKKAINLSDVQSDNKEISLTELEAELDFLHTGISDEENTNENETASNEAALDEKEKTIAAQEIVAAEASTVNEDKASEVKAGEPSGKYAMEALPKEAKKENAETLGVNKGTIDFEYLGADAGKSSPETDKNDESVFTYVENGKSYVRMNPNIKYGRRMDYRTAKATPIVNAETKESSEVKDIEEVKEETKVEEVKVAEDVNAVVEVKTEAASSVDASAVAAPATESVSEIKAENTNEIVETETEANKSKEEKAEPEVKRTVKPIHNPLPTPKKHISKHLEYDIEIDDSQMHFDLLDMSGMDNFDIN